eukprot:m.46493 g.46493  ORF g.46493 m.46493 type:complete len:672 (-) comp5925_c0_seq2:183-2198(-)
MDSYRLLADFQTSSGLTVPAGTIVQVKDLDPSGWWLGTWSGGSDWLPSSYLQKCAAEGAVSVVADNLYVNHEETVAASPLATGSKTTYVNAPASDDYYGNAPTPIRAPAGKAAAPSPAATTIAAPAPVVENLYSNTNAPDPTEAMYSTANDSLPSQPPEPVYSTANDSLPEATKPSVRVSLHSAMQEQALSKQEIAVLYAVPKRRPPSESLESPSEVSPPAPLAPHSDDDSDGSGDEAPLSELSSSRPAPTSHDTNFTTLYEQPNAGPSKPPPPPAPRSVQASNPAAAAAVAAALASAAAGLAITKSAPPPVAPKRFSAAAPLPPPSPSGVAPPVSPAPPPPVPDSGVIYSVPNDELPPSAPAPTPHSPALPPAPSRKAPPPPPGAQPLRQASRGAVTKGAPPPPGGMTGSPTRPVSIVGTPAAAMAPLPGAQIIDTPLPITTSIDLKVNSELAADLAYLKDALSSWTGPDGSHSQLRLLHHGRLMKISKGKAQCREFFLFDHILVYCKREKRRLELRGDLPMVELIFKDAPDGRIKHGATPLINAFEIHNYKKNKWYTCYAYSGEEKRRWLRALEEERKGVKDTQQVAVKVTVSKDASGFGFAIAELENAEAGGRVSSIRNSALCPGLLVGDRLWQFDGIGVHRMPTPEIRLVLDRTPPGQPVTLVVHRA